MATDIKYTRNRPAPAGSDPSTSELRHDWLADRWVIVAPQRGERPDDFVRRPVETAPPVNCPFCAGHESDTPSAVLTLRRSSERGSSDNWAVRVIPNKYPAVKGSPIQPIDQARPSDSVQPSPGSADSASALGTSQRDIPARTSESAGTDTSTPGSNKPRPNPVADRLIDDAFALPVNFQGTYVNQFERVDTFAPETPLTNDNRWSADPATNQSLDLFQCRPLTGGHEVIVESPHHVQSLSDLDRETTSLVFQAYRQRIGHWLHQSGQAYVIAFKNVGHEAGASLAHTHSQVIAASQVPADVQRQLTRMQHYQSEAGCCLFCRMVEDELAQAVRVIEETPDFVAICPFASRLPSLISVLPKTHQSDFSRLNDFEIDQLSWLTHRLVRRLEKCYPQTAYNFVIQTAPRAFCGSPAFHWRLELFPRLTRVAGFEWGSDCFINPLAPEEAARNLRCAGV